MNVKVKDEKLKVIIFGIIFGFLVHGFVISNKFVNSDDILNMISSNDMLKSGRWFLKYASSISGNISIPWLIGIISIILITITSYIIIEVIGIEDMKYKLLIVMFMQTFEVVAGTFSYMFTADAYFIAMLLAVLGVGLVKSNKYIVGILCMTFSIAIYQSYISFSIGLFCILIFKDCLDNKDIKDIIKKGFIYIISVGIALVLYYVILKILLNLNKITLTDYQGISAINPLSLLLSSVYKAINGTKEFIKYFTTEQISRGHSFYVIIYMLAIVLGGIQLISMIVSKKIYKQIARLALMLATIILMPICFNSIYLFINEGTQVHTLMIYGLVSVFVVLILVLQKYDKDTTESKVKSKFKSKIVTASIVVLLISVYQQYLYTNEIYFAQYLNYQTTYANATSIMTRISSIEGFNEETPVFIIGDIDKNRLYSERSFDRIYEHAPVTKFGAIYNYTMYNYLQRYTGFKLKPPSLEQKDRIINSEEFKNMEGYPSNSSIKMVEEVLVVKLGHIK